MTAARLGVEGPVSELERADDGTSGHREITIIGSNGSTLTFEFDARPLEITPGLAKVLLRILRKAAVRRGVDVTDTDIDQRPPGSSSTFHARAPRR